MINHIKVRESFKIKSYWVYNKYYGPSFLKCVWILMKFFKKSLSRKKYMKYFILDNIVYPIKYKIVKPINIQLNCKLLKNHKFISLTYYLDGYVVYYQCHICEKNISELEYITYNRKKKISKLKNRIR